MNWMRVLVSTILGFIAGIVCYLLAKSGSNEPLGPWLTWSIIFGRTLIGFVIGISAWRINYLIHGVLIGLIVSFPMALGAGKDGGTTIFWMTLIMGGIYGFFIALITNLIVKEKKETPQAAA